MDDLSGKFKDRLGELSSSRDGGNPNRRELNELFDSLKPFLKQRNELKSQIDVIENEIRDLDQVKNKNSKKIDPKYNKTDEI